MAATAIQLIAPGLAQISGWCSPKKLQRGDVLFHQGDLASSLFLVETGLVRLTCVLEDGREVVMRVVRPDDLLGDRVLRGDVYREATADALSECQLYEIPAREFLDRSSRSPELWTWVTRQLEQRIDEVERRIQLISFYRVKQRLMLLLADLADVFPSSAKEPAVVTLTQSELAQLVGATRETASTALNEMERQGLVCLGRGSVKVFRPPQLRRMALSDA